MTECKARTWDEGEGRGETVQKDVLRQHQGQRLHRESYLVFSLNASSWLNFPIAYGNVESFSSYINP